MRRFFRGPGKFIWRFMVIFSFIMMNLVLQDNIPVDEVMGSKKVKAIVLDMVRMPP